MMIRHVHLIGIGGTGLSAIATVLLERGDMVSGSDRQVTAMTKRLEKMGATVFVGHKAENITGADIVVRSSAVKDDNPEVKAALELGIPVLKRSAFLSYLTASQKTIAVAGTHGKTTTTAMIAEIFSELAFDPSFVIGGVSANLGRNAHAGEGEYFVIEADEYDHMFLGLDPFIAVLTSVEYDHPDCFPTPIDFLMAFETFTDRVLENGVLLSKIDDKGAAWLHSRALRAGRKTLAYSLEDPHADYYAGNPRLNENGCYMFDLYKQGELLVEEVYLQVPGLHNIANALAALAVSDLLDLPLEHVKKALSRFRGTERRFEIRGVRNGITIIDDYGHHPTEIKATLAAARARYPGQRIWAIWQPHTYSRTRLLQHDFSRAFGDADFVIVSEVYPAREQPPADGYSASEAAKKIQTQQEDGIDKVHFISQLDQIGDFLLNNLQSGDVVLIFSAGDANQISERLLQELA